MGNFCMSSERPSDGPQNRNSYCLNDFELINMQASGNHARIVLALHKSLKTNMIFKIVRLGLHEHELNILSKLKPHVNIIHFYGYFNDFAYCYMILEYCPQGSLTDLLRLQKFQSIPRALKQLWVRNLLQILLYLNEECLVHGDIKLDNLLCGQRNYLKLIDFEFSSYLSSKINCLDRLQGTLINYSPERLVLFQDYIIMNDYSTKKVFKSYVTPEMIENTKKIDHSLLLQSWDIWTVGIVVFQILCGYHPFQDQNFTQTISNVLSHKLSIPDFIEPMEKRVLEVLLSFFPLERLKLLSLLSLSWSSLLLTPTEEKDSIACSFIFDADFVLKLEELD